MAEPAPTITHWKAAHFGPLKTAGFTKNNRGWRLANDLGDVAIVDVYSRNLPGFAVNFGIGIGVVPAPWLDWLASRIGGVPRGVTYATGLYKRLLESPNGSILVPGVPLTSNVTWQYDTAEQAASLGGDLEQLLVDDAVPTLTKLLNRDFFLDHVRAEPNDPALKLHGTSAEGVLLADLDRPTELNSVLERLGQDHPITIWIRSRRS